MAEVEHDIDALEEKVRTAMEEVKNLDNDLLEGVLEVIRLPGWTSSAEFVFAMGLTEALIDHLVLARKLQARSSRERVEWRRPSSSTHS